MVHDGEDRIMSVGLGETYDEVHGYLLERECGRICWDFVHRRASVVCDDFVLLTCRAPLDVFCDPRAHVWPPIVSFGLGNCFVTTGVPGYKAFVHDSHDFLFKREVWWDR